MPMVRQVSFAGGELAPTLYGRADLAKYAVGAKRLRNFFVARTGHAVSRPGSTYVSEVKTSAAGKVRLIPFVYSDGLSYVLEFGAGYIRFYTNGSVVLSGGIPYEVATPYATADLPRLKYAQTGAVLTLTHPSYPPAELTWSGSTSWAYVAISFDRPAPTYATDSRLNHFSLTPAALNTLPIYVTSDNNHIGIAWIWKVTEIRRDSRGNPYETAPYMIQFLSLDFYLPWSPSITYQLGTKVNGGANNYRSIQANNLNHVVTDAAWWVVDNLVTVPVPVQTDGALGPIVVTADRPVVVRFAVTPGSLADPNLLAYRIYRGQGGIYGWVGDARNDTFTDIGATPDYTQGPPQGLNPFKVYDSSGTLVRTEYPACVSFFEERRVFAGTTQRSSFSWMSVTGDYANFDTPLVPTADASLSYEIASRKFEEVRSVVPVGPKFIEFTNSSFWIVGGSQGPIQASDIDAKRQGEVGASWVDPLVLDEGVLFVRSKGTGVRVANSDLLRQGLSSVDLSILANQLFVGHQLLDWCHAEDPWGLVWAVRDDGILLSLTYVREHDVWAWTWHDTQGSYESICSVPEGQEDAVYCVVNRTILGLTKRYVERFSTRVITPATAKQAVCLDCAGIYNGTPTTQLTGLNWLNGQQVYVLADGVVDGPFQVNNGVVTLNTAASYVVCGLPFTPELQQLDPAIPSVETKGAIKSVTRLDVEVDNARGLLYGTDFDHLVEAPSRQVSDGYGVPGLVSTLVRVPILGDWNTKASACLRQTQPLPVSVLSVEREFDVGSD